MHEVKRRYYALVFVLLLGLTTTVENSFERFDWKVFGWLNTQQTAWPDEFHLVDVSWDRNPATTESFRRDLARTLRALAELPTPPQLVVLDVSISSLPLALDELGMALDALKARNTRVLAAVAVLDDMTAEPTADYLNRHAREQVYDRLPDLGYGHTEFHTTGGVVWYLPCLALSAPDTAVADRCVPALAVKAAELVKRRDADRSPTQPPIVVPLGDPPPATRRWTLDAASARLVGTAQGERVHADAGAALAHGVVIVGNLQHDRIGLLGGRPGTELVGWMLADQLSPPRTATRLQLLTERGWLVGFTAAFSLLGVLGFSTLRRRVPVLRLNLVACWLLSLALVLALLAVVVVGLRVALAAVYPQVSFAALASVFAVSLTAHRSRMKLRARAMQEDVSAGAAGGTQEVYDVFISYSRTPRENAAWVAENLFGPLSRAQIDGRPLRIFFDQTSIRVGTAWYFKLAEAIQASRCFVAVYSDEYFQKDFCKFEMGKAAVRLIKDRQFAVVPIVRGEPRIPPAFDHIQALPAGEPAQMVAQIIAALPPPPPRA
jgi:hypothetical protein